MQKLFTTIIILFTSIVEYIFGQSYPIQWTEQTKQNVHLLLLQIIYRHNMASHLNTPTHQSLPFLFHQHYGSMESMKNLN